MNDGPALIVPTAEDLAFWQARDAYAPEDATRPGGDLERQQGAQPYWYCTPRVSAPGCFTISQLAKLLVFRSHVWSFFDEAAREDACEDADEAAAHATACQGELRADAAPADEAEDVHGEAQE